MKDLLLKQNTHWQKADIAAGNRRDILGKILQYLDVRHVIAIAGARRSGKSYLFRQIIDHLTQGSASPQNILQINFEDPFFVQRRESPDVIEECFLEYMKLKNPRGRIYLFLDEIQNISSWQFWVRDIYDRNETIKIFITGSNSELLSNELATHLTGRVIAFENFPYSYSEYLRGTGDTSCSIAATASNADTIYQSNYNNRNEIIHYIEAAFTGGLFPETCYLGDIERTDFMLRQYFQNVLFSDIIPRFSVRNTKTIEELAYYCSTNITSPFSYHKLAEAVGSNENTVREYMTYFEKAYLFFEVSYFEYSLKKQFRRNRKIYMIDNGLRHASSFSFSDDRGRYAENAVFLMLRRRYTEIFYWQEDRTLKEVDFIIRDQGRIVAINVTYDDIIHDREYEGLLAFSKASRAERYIIISRDTFDTRRVGDITIEIIPFWVCIFVDFHEQEQNA